MTPNAPSFKEIEDFLRIDGWTEAPTGHGSKHRFFEKVLPSGEVLTTHISHSAKKSPGAGRFAEMLREQLRIKRSTSGTRSPAASPSRARCPSTTRRGLPRRGRSACSSTRSGCPSMRFGGSIAIRRRR